MPRNVQIVLEVDDRGTAKIRQMGRAGAETSKKLERESQTAFARMSASAQNAIDTMTRRFLRWGSITAGILGGVALRAAVRFGTEFERRMSGVRAVTQASGVDFAKLKDQARDLGATTIYTANQAAEAMEELSKAGFTTTETLAAMPDVLNLAAAGELEMAQAAEIAAVAIRAMGLEATEMGRVADALAKVATSSKTTVAELGLALQDATPIARALGVDIEALGALLGILADRGFVATRAGTALRRIFAVLLGDLEEGEQGVEKFNLTVRDAEGDFVGFASILEQLSERGADFNDILESFGLRGGPAFVNIMLAGEDAVRDFEEAIRGAGGEADRVATERMANLWGRTKELSSAMQEVALVVFDQVAPALTGIAERVTAAARAFGRALSMSDVMSAVKRAVTLATAAVGLYAIAIGIGLVQKLRAATAATIAFALANDQVAVAAMTSAGAIRNLTLLTAAQAASVAGLAAGFALAGWQLGRFAGEALGLDAIVTKLYEQKLFKGDVKDAERAIVDLEEKVSLLQRTLRNLEREGVDIDATLDPDLDRLLRGEIIEAMEKLVAFAGGTPVVMTAEGRLEVDDLKRQIEEFKAGAPIELEFLAKGATDFLTDVVEQLHAAGELTPEMRNKLTEVRGEVDETVAALVHLLKQTRSLNEADLSLLLESLEEAAEETDGTVKVVARAWAIYQEKREDAAKAAIKAKQDEAAALRDLEQRHEALLKAIESAGLATTEMADRVANDVTRAFAIADDTGIDAELVWRAFEKQIDETVAAIERAGQEIPESLADIKAGLDKFRDDQDSLLPDDFFEPVAEVNASLAPLTLEDFEGLGPEFLPDLQAYIDARMAGEPVEIKPPVVVAPVSIGELEEQLSAAQTALQEAEAGFAEGDVDRAFVMQARMDLQQAEEDLADWQAMVEEAVGPLGEEIADVVKPPDPTEWEDFWAVLGESSAHFVQTIGEQWGAFTNQAISSFGRLAGDVLTGTTKLSKAAGQLLRQMTSQAISLLVQWLIKKLIVSKFSQAATAAENATQLAGSFAATFANTFASISAIPIIGPAMAPGAAETALTLVQAGAAKAAAQGAGTGAATAAVAGSAEGSLVTEPRIVKVSELGDEAIVPLTGTAADAVRERLGLEEVRREVRELRVARELREVREVRRTELLERLDRVLARREDRRAPEAPRPALVEVRVREARGERDRPAEGLLGAREGGMGRAAVLRLLREIPGAQEGGLALEPTLLRAAEAGAEAIVPLEGAAAERVGRTIGAGGKTINVEGPLVALTITGDNWAETGVPAALVRVLRDELEELVSEGLELGLSEGI